MRKAQGVLNLGLERALNPVANPVRLGHAHLTRHGEVKVTKAGRPHGVCANQAAAHEAGNVSLACRI